MKKSIIALAVLAATTGVAQAATSVTLYGRADIGYTRTTGDSGVTSVSQKGGGENRVGIKGEEDLGDGYAATFQLEGRFDGDTGEKTQVSAIDTTKRPFFDRESTVGLKTPYGAVRFGTSLASMERGIGFINIGRRIADLSNYKSAARHANAAFYDYSNGAVSFGGDVTTRSGYTPTSVEGAGNKVSYGAYGKYSANGLTAGVGFQSEGVKLGDAPFGTTYLGDTKEWGVGLAYTFSPVMVGASYAQLKNAVDAKTRTIQGYLGTGLTANDMVGVLFQQQQTKNAADAVTAKTTKMGLGYVHSLSKRTSVYANVAQVKNNTADTKSMVWDLAMRHNF